MSTGSRRVLFDKETGTIRRITAVAIHHQNEFRVDRAEGRGNGRRLAAAAFGDHLRSSAAGGCRGSIVGAVVDDEDGGLRESRAVLAHDVGNAEGFIQTGNEHGE